MLLNEAEATTIADRVRAIEAATGAQVVVAIVGRSDVYHGLRWRAFAFGAAFAVVPGAATSPLLQAVGIARNARVPLCPPNPMEFDNAPVTRTVRA